MQPHYTNGFGDAGGMIFLLLMEGIAPAMKAERYAAEAMAQYPHHAGVDRAMSAIPTDPATNTAATTNWGHTVRLINPRIMRLCTTYILPSRLMTLVLQASVGWLRTPRRRPTIDYPDGAISMMAEKGYTRCAEER